MREPQGLINALLIVEDDAELRSLTGALFQDLPAPWTESMWRARGSCAGRFFPVHPGVETIDLASLMAPRYPK